MQNNYISPLEFSFVLENTVIFLFKNTVYFKLMPIKADLPK